MSDHDTTTGTLEFNKDHHDWDTKIYADSATPAIMVDGSTDRVGIFTDTPETALDVAGDISAERLNLEKSSGYASIELGGSSGAFIDMKNPFSDDFDCRLITDGTGLDIIAAGAGNHITLKTNGTERFQVEDAAVTFFNAYAFPNADGSANQVLKTDGSGALSWTDQSGGSSFSVSDITGATALTSGLASTDELVLSDAGTLKRMDISVLRDYMTDNLSQLKARDARADGDITPDDYQDYGVDFTFTDDIPNSPSSWDGVITFKGWGDSYSAWQLMSSNESDAGGNKENNSLMFRSGEDDTWGTLRKVITEDGGGQVGIGTGFNTDAVNTLEIHHSAADGDDGIMIVNEATTITQGTLLGGIGFDSKDGNVPSSITEASAYIASYAGQDHSATEKGGELAFGHTYLNEDDDTTSTEVMRITGRSGVGIGTTTPAPQTFDCAQQSRFRRAIVNEFSSNISVSGTLLSGTVIHCTGECTMSLQASPEIGEQYVFFNSSSETVTISANGSDTINGSTDDITLGRNKGTTVIALSTSAWIAIGGQEQ